MTARASSIYSLRYYPVALSPGRALSELARSLARTGTLRQDSHVRTEGGRTYAAIGFRAKDDGEARRIVSEVLDFALLNDLRAQLFTGFGSARREVEL